MFDLDTWQETFVSLRHKKLRAALTALGVFWGSFMLILMLGCGNGLRAGVERNIVGFATNSVYVWGLRTGKPFRGIPPGRLISFGLDDLTALRRSVRGLDLIAPRVQLGAWRAGNNVSRNSRSGDFGVTGDYPELSAIQGLHAYRGRFLNAIDILQYRKVSVIGEEVRRQLFDASEDPIGQYLRVRGAHFMVVGVLNSSRPGDIGDRENNGVYIPFTTFQRSFNGKNRVDWLAITAKQTTSGVIVEQSVRRLLANRHAIAPNDRQALASFNASETFDHVDKLFTGVTAFIWVVGIVTLLAGVLGVSNIMLISVKERTTEIGIRKALGATAMSVVALVVREAIVLTSMAGYAGLVTAVLSLEALGRLASGSGPLSEPIVDLRTALLATLVIVAAGTAASVAPARYASKLRPVVALRAQ